jgi:outer membrane protein assembly factor BamB
MSSRQHALWNKLNAGLVLAALTAPAGLLAACDRDEPARTTHEPTTSPSSPSSEPGTSAARLLWRYSTGDEINAPPLAVGDKIVVATHHGDVLALNRQGQLLWKESVSHGNTAGQYGFVFDPLVASHGVVFVSGQDTGVHAFDVDSGRLLWRYRGVGQHTAGPALGAGRLFVAGTHGVVALDPQSGRERWVTPTQETVSPPVFAGGAVIVRAQGSLIALDARTGLRRWAVPDTGSTLIAQAGVLYRASSRGRNDRELSAMLVASGEINWSRSSTGPSFGSLALDEHGHLLTNDGTEVYCIDAGAGRTRWTRRVSNTTTAARLIRMHAGLAIATRQQGLIALDARTGEPIWDFNTSEPYSLSISDGVAYLGLTDGLLALEPDPLG